MKRQGRFVMNSLATLVSMGLFVLLIHMESCQHLFNRLLGIQVDNFITDNSAVASRLCSKHREVLYGIFSVPGKAQHWAVVRQQSQCNLNSDIHSTVFVVGTPQTTSNREIVMRESKTHSDVFILTCQENMNEGKTFTYFKEALDQFPCFNFYAKVDDDTAFAPNKLSARILAIPNDGPLLIGRNSAITESDFERYILKTALALFRDTTWYYPLQNYTAGMLYILNTQAVKKWVALHPTQLYGDEDCRTTYYMELIGAKVVNLGTAFHDYIEHDFGAFKGHWKLEITKESLAVHKCKSQKHLSDAFASICTV